MSNEKSNVRCHPERAQRVEGPLLNRASFGSTGVFRLHAPKTEARSAQHDSEITAHLLDALHSGEFKKLDSGIGSRVDNRIGVKRQPWTGATERARSRPGDGYDDATEKTELSNRFQGPEWNRQWDSGARTVLQRRRMRQIGRGKHGHFAVLRTTTLASRATASGQRLSPLSR